MKMPDPWQVANWIVQLPLPADERQQANKALFRLHGIVHTDLHVVSYLEDNQELDEVLQIFIRMNDGGTPLSHSDLLLSTVVAQWNNHEAREEIHGFVDQLNRVGVGFAFPKDLVLKAGLMLSDIGRLGFKVNNFNKRNMDIFEAKWDGIKRSLLLTARLLADFGFSSQNLRANNAILPIAYYLYQKNPGEGYLTHIRFHDERRAVRDWLVCSLLKPGVWSSGADALLTALRSAIRDDCDAFPAAKVYAAMPAGKSLAFGEEELENLADMQYGDRLTFALLSLLFPHVDLRNQFHIDHVFPAARFTERRLKDCGVPEDQIADFRQRMNGLGNLQLLQGPQNLEKSASMPAEWLREAFPDQESRQQYQNLHLLRDAPKSITGFLEFYEARRSRLKDRIGALLGRDTQPTTAKQG